jgi:plastocyanin
MKTGPVKKFALFFLMLPAFCMIVSSCSGYGTSSATTSTSTSANAVTIINFAFSPATLTIKAGTSVTWTNKDSVAHTVVSDSGIFSSGSLATNATYSYTFKTAGTFTYKCSIHPSMTGTITVQ